MDLRLLAAEPTRRRARGDRRRRRRGRDERPPRRSREPDGPAPPAARSARRAAPRRLGERGSARLRVRRLDVPPADAYGVASFYALIALEERAPDVLHVCTDLACRLAGVRAAPPGAHASPCLGLCERAPAALRTIAGEHPRELPHPETSPPLPQARRARAAPAPPHRGRTRSRVARRLPQPRRLRRAASRDRARPGRRAARGERLPSPRPRRRRLPDRHEVGGRRAPAGAAALPRLQRRRIGAGNVQGPRAASRATRSRSSRR